MSRLPQAARESDRGERPGANHDGVGGMAKRQGGQTNDRANHPRIVPAGLHSTLANGLQRLAGHEGAAGTDHSKQNA